jgi:hypothetical protein
MGEKAGSVSMPSTCGKINGAATGPAFLICSLMDDCRQLGNKDIIVGAA